MIAGLVACGGPYPSHSPEDPCTTDRCVDDVASARSDGVGNNLTGYALAAAGDEVYVAAPQDPCMEGCGTGGPHVDVLAVGTLDLVARWRGENFTFSGTSVDARDVDGDGGAEVAIGEFAAFRDGTKNDPEGAVRLVRSVAQDADIPTLATLTYWGDTGARLGVSVRYAEVGPYGSTALLAGANGTGGVYVLDPTLEGVFGTEVASASILGGVGFGQAVAAWDADGDGQQDVLSVTLDQGVAWFHGPLTGQRSSADADGEWTQVGDDDNLADGDNIVPAGDLTGDGRGDLLLGAFTASDPVERAGRTYVVTDGDFVSGPVARIPIQVRGSEPGEAVGYGNTWGDVTGDGQDDLVVGARGLPPAWVPGSVWVFEGPIDGVLGRDDAIAILDGEQPGDGFGRRVLTVDADGDAQRDLVITADTWPGGEGRGAVWLVPGAALP